MTELVLPIAVVIVVAAVMVGLFFLASRARRRGTAGAALAGAMAAYDEAMHSTAHDTFVEMQQQADRTTPMPAPDDK